MIKGYQKREVRLPDTQFKKLKIKVFKRDKNTCQLPDHICKGDLAPHHIIPKGRLRLDILENLLTACMWGHRLLHDGNLSVSIDDLIDQYELRHHFH